MFLVRNRGLNGLRQCQRRLSKYQNSPSNQLSSTKRQNQGYTRLFAVNPRVYAEIAEETTCIHDCKSKTRIEEEKVHINKVNIQDETYFTPIRIYQAYMPPDPTQKQERKSNSNTLNAEKITPKGKLLGTPQRSHQFYYGEKLLWLGYHNRQLDSRNQSFPICNRN